MTLREYIVMASDESLAHMLIQSRSEEEWDYDYEENPVFYGTREWYETTDGEQFLFLERDAYKKAVEHQIFLLDEEYINTTEEVLYDLFR